MLKKIGEVSLQFTRSRFSLAKYTVHDFCNKVVCITKDYWGHFVVKALGCTKQHQSHLQLKKKEKKKEGGGGGGITHTYHLNKATMA